MLYADVVTGRRTTGFGISGQDNSYQFWEEMQHALATALGQPVLSQRGARSAAEDAMAFAQHASAADLFTFIETSFRLDMSSRYFSDENEFIDAINDIFRSEASPYQVTHGVHRREPMAHNRGVSIIRVAFPKVIRVDEEVTHIEAVEPALSALSHPAYTAASDEFRKALEDYHAGDFEDCLGKCGSALESVLKVLCTRNQIVFDPQKDTAPSLLDKALPRSTLDIGTFKEPLMAVARMPEPTEQLARRGNVCTQGRTPCRPVRRLGHRRRHHSACAGHGQLTRAWQHVSGAIATLACGGRDHNRNVGWSQPGPLVEAVRDVDGPGPVATDVGADVGTGREALKTESRSADCVESTAN